MGELGLDGVSPDFIHSPFKSFWMGGFECADQLNAFGERVDFLKLTGHFARINEDYAALSSFKIATVREGIRWSNVEKVPYRYDWTEVREMIAAGQAHGIQQLWDICHFGFPDDLTPLHPMFPRRFACLCREFVRLYRTLNTTGTLIVTPINEVGFLSWLGGDVRGTSPYCVGQGWEVKYRLMKAYIEGIEAMREIDSEVRILATEPLINITHNVDAQPEEIAAAHRAHDQQFQVLEMLSGRMCPELRGHSSYLDLLGFNFYYNNQWIHSTGENLVWKHRLNDRRWKNLSDLVVTAYRRYRRPVVLSETSHPKEDRPLWVEMIGTECERMIQAEVPLLGVCWYPVVDRPDWDRLQNWHQSGIWDREEGVSERVLHRPTAAALNSVQQRLAAAGPGTPDHGETAPERGSHYRAECSYWLTHSGKMQV